MHQPLTAPMPLQRNCGGYHPFPKKNEKAGECNLFFNHFLSHPSYVAQLDATLRIALIEPCIKEIPRLIEGFRYSIEFPSVRFPKPRVARSIRVGGYHFFNNHIEV